MAPECEAATLEGFADLIEQGLVHRRLKAVHWSVANETALADAELEYIDREDTSVYVEFDAADRVGVARAFSLSPADLDRTPTFMILTTTPWTLPANLLVAVNPKFTYALVEIEGTLTIVAEAAVERVARLEKAESVRIVARAPGDALVGLRYRHPLHDAADLARALQQRERERAGGNPPLPEVCRVVGAEYVTLEDGTGLVHTAPGHGEEDYLTGLREALPIYCPVLGDGRYDDSAPQWLRGVIVWDANPLIVDRLRSEGRLFHAHRFTHSYPHDWRGKSPVIFRATEQWFIGVDDPRKSDGKSLRALALAGTEKAVRFIPEWGRNRMRGMLESRPDWCVSRQRAWGLPIPAFETPDGKILLTPASVRAVAARVREKGSDCWFTETPAQLLGSYEPARDPGAPGGVSIGALKKTGDILDVWFESGSTWRSVMQQRGFPIPVDLYLEGSDQHRGWFQSSLLVGIGCTGAPPYRALLTHGFMVDKDGKKMSKSLGNTLEVEDLLKDFGADVCRWWVASLAYENDVKVDLEFFKTAGDSYRKVRNTLRFMLSCLDGFDRAAPVPVESMSPRSLEAWILSECDGLTRRVLGAYREFDFKAAQQAIYDFCNDTLSSVYLGAAKDRLYCDAPDSPRRRATQTALWGLTDTLCRLLAPLLPHTADEAWRTLVGATDEASTVHVAGQVALFGARADERWGAALAARDGALKAMEAVRAGGAGVENPLDAGLVLPDPEGALATFDPVDLADLMGVSRVTLQRSAGAVQVQDLRHEPRCERSWKRDGTVRQRSDGGMLSDRDARAVGVA
jgi:isoleucyl-tRNA synthetase